MNRVTRGTAVLAAVLVVLSCKGDPTSDLRNGIDHLVATPSALFIPEDSTEGVRIEAVDEQGNRLEGRFNLGTVGAGITVVLDSTFNLVRNSDGDLVVPERSTRVRYLVTAATATANTSFTVSVSGKSITIPVRLVPRNLPTTNVSATTPAVGDTITITAPAPFRWSATSQPTAPGGTLVRVDISADSSALRAVVGPGVNGAVSVSNSRLSYAPSIGTFTLMTAAPVTSPTITTVNVSYNSATPAGGDTLAITLPSNYRFLGNAGVARFGSQESYRISLSADSLTLRVVPPPGYSGAVTVQGFALDFLLGASLTASSTTNVTVGAGVAGSDNLATAPPIALPAPGSSIQFYDNGAPFAAAVVGNDRVYRLDIAVATPITVGLDWSNTADVDILFRNSTNTAFVCSFAGATGARPENAGCTLNPGTYYLVGNLYSGTAPAVLKWTISVQ